MWKFLSLAGWQDTLVFSSRYVCTEAPTSSWHLDVKKTGWTGDAWGFERRKGGAYLSSCSWMYFPKRLLLLFLSVQAFPADSTLLMNDWEDTNYLTFKNDFLLSYQRPPLEDWSPTPSSLSSLLCPDSSSLMRRLPPWHSISSDNEKSMSRKNKTNTTDY